jgi:hypothetical protein
MASEARITTFASVDLFRGIVKNHGRQMAKAE